jgi:hypothetical protein
MLLTFLLALGAFAAPPPRDHGYRPAFHHADCARYFLRRASQVRAIVFDGVPNHLGALVGRAPVAGVRLDFDLERVPDFLWFTNDDDQSARESARRIAAAMAEPDPAEPFRRGRKRLSRTNFDQPLTVLEKSALGVASPLELAPVELRGHVSHDGRTLRLRWAARGEIVGGFDLDSADVDVGYTNSVYEWQYLLLNLLHEDRSAGPGQSFKPRVSDFFETEVRALLRRGDEADRRFGYFLTSYDLGGPEPVLEMEVFTLRPCARLATTGDGVIFPRADDARPGQINVRLSDLGLRLLLTSTRACE